MPYQEQHPYRLSLKDHKKESTRGWYILDIQLGLILYGYLVFQANWVQTQ
jgi:hypothetical protein